MTDQQDQKQEEQDIRFYQKMIARTEELLESGRKNLDDAVKKAGEELASAGDYTREQKDRVSAAVKRDLQNAVNLTSRAGENVRQAVDPRRIAAGTHSLVAKILSSTAETLEQWARKSEQQIEFKTGQMTGPGTLTCKGCSEEIHLTRTSKIPPCPQCHKTQFRKSY